MGKIQIARSVRDFIMPLEPSGSIDVSLGFQLEEDAAAQGALTHRKIQKRLAAEHTDILTEHPLRWAGGCTDGYGSFECTVRGRVDVIIANATGSPPVIEEIKSTYRPNALLKALEENPLHPFSQQVRMYAWMFLQGKGAAVALGATCRIRVASLLDYAETLVEIPYYHDAFSNWVDGQLKGLFLQQLRALKRAEERRSIGGQLRFPFDSLRPGQQRMQDLVGKTLDEGAPLLVQAPTGLGKTVAVLFPAIKKALCDNLRVFYLTPRNSQHTVAEAAVTQLCEAGHRVRSVTVRAKERVCPQDEVHCHPDACPMADGYYDRLKESGALERLAEMGCVDSAAIQKTAENARLCPFELSLDAACNADVIICDYNYALAPQATLSRFFGDEESQGQNILLLDEAHNLHSRATAWFSPVLDKGILASLKKAWGGKTGGKTSAQKNRFTRQLNRCIKLVASFKGPTRSLEDLDPGPFFAEEHGIRELLAKTAGEGGELPPGDPLVLLHRQWADFCGVLRQRTDAHLITWGHPGSLKITCVDASGHLAARLEAAGGAVLFSATLKPFAYYERLSGLEGCVCEEIPSPFPPENRRVMIVPQISTLYRNRAWESPRIAGFISRVVPLMRGNYLVFFPSFDFLEAVLPLLSAPGFEIMAQPRHAGAGDIELILESLRQRQGLVVLAVAGGSLAEGIDLPGDALIGCIVVGPPIPPFDLERRLTKDYFAGRPGINAENYTYIYPAMSKAVQAAGRVIRGPDEPGLLIFLDNRFLSPDFAVCFPCDWFESPKDTVSVSILADIREFWERTRQNQNRKLP